MRVLEMVPFVAWPSSLLLHAGIFAALVQLPLDLGRVRPSSVVSFSVASRPNAQARPAPLAPPPTPASPAPPKAVTPKAFAATAAPPSPTPASAAAPVDLTGVTLTGGNGAGWTSMTGNGQAMDAPLRPTVVAAARSPVPPKSNLAPSTSAPRAPEVVPVRDLAAKPMPPLLDAQLLRNYPPDAKRQGLAGKAVVVARVDADGLIRRATVRSETRTGFGAACERTLLGSRWSAPRDRGGRPVATQIYYTCDFRVDG